MSYILALDQGTTSSRAIVFDHAAQPVAIAQREFEQHFPKPGLVEHDAGEIWNSQLAVAREAIDRAGATAMDIAGLGITNQRETTVVWDRATGEPIHRAIVWQDRRTAPICRELDAAGYSNLIHERTGLLLDAYFAGTKITWILDQVDGARKRAEAGELAFGTMDTWVLWNITAGKVHATDATNASRTMLFNIHQGVWDDELLELLEVPRAVLPEVKRSGDRFGDTANGVFDRPIPIAGIAGDQQSALLGQLCTEPGMAKNTYGTGCFLLLHTGSNAIASNHQLLTTRACSVVEQPAYAMEGSIFTAGATIQWLRDQLGIIESSPDVERLAQTVDDHGGVYLVPAFAGLGAPDWDPDARGAILGLTRGSTAGHIARAALEGIAFQVADVLDAMASDTGQSITELRVDGGAAANDLLMQIQADLAQIPVVRPVVQETTALGAAYLAGLGVGFWDSVEVLREHWQLERRFEPAISAEAAAERRQRWRQAVQRAGRWAQE